MSIPLVNPVVEDLLSSVRLMLRQPDPNNSNWTDGELLAYLNEAVRVYFAELTDIDEGHFTTTADLSLVSGAEEITLPSDFFKIKVVYKKQTNGYASLPYRNVLNEGYSTELGSSPDLYMPFYFFRGNKLVVRPAPGFNEIAGLRIEYMQFPSTLIDGGDQLTNQIAPAFRQVIEMYAVYKAKLVESLVTGVATYGPAKENLSELTEQFRKINAFRSKNPTFVVPWNPEEP